jgi:hypothetical protein
VSEGVLLYMVDRDSRMEWKWWIRQADYEADVAGMNSMVRFWWPHRA